MRIRTGQRVMTAMVAAAGLLAAARDLPLSASLKP